MFSPSLNTTYAVLTFDVNPSIEFDLNDEGKILNVKGINDDVAMLNIEGKYEAIVKLDEYGVEEAFENLSTQELLDLLKANNSNVFLNEDALDELQDKIEDRLEDETEDKEDDDHD